MFSTLGLILIGFAGFSAAFTIFVFLFGNKGTFLNLVKNGPGGAAGAPGLAFPVGAFPAIIANQAIAANAFANGDALDIQLNTLGLIFLVGGGVATLLLAVLAFLSPTTILNKCCIKANCLPKDCCPNPCAPPPPPAPACGCGA